MPCDHSFGGFDQQLLYLYELGINKLAIATTNLLISIANC